VFGAGADKGSQRKSKRRQVISLVAYTCTFFQKPALFLNFIEYKLMVCYHLPANNCSVFVGGYNASTSPGWDYHAVTFWC
jgi:hypothetical protein